MDNNKQKTEPLLYWKARDTKFDKRSVDWYWFFWIFTFILIIISLYFNPNKSGSILAILIFLIASVSTYLSVKPTNIRQYSIDEKGVYINNGKKLIPFTKIEEYNIDEKGGYILINTKNKFERILDIPYEENHDIEVIDKFLEEKIKKNEELKLPTAETLLRNFLGW